METGGSVAGLRITVNGLPREVPSGVSVEDLVAELGLPKDRVAVERNRGIVRRDQRSLVRVEDGDIFEVVTFVGGG